MHAVARSSNGTSSGSPSAHAAMANGQRTRNAQPDGGAHIFAESIHKIRARLPECKIEVLIPDFDGNWDALKMVMDAQPDVLNHNIETVPRIFRRFRPRAGFPPRARHSARRLSHNISAPITPRNAT